MRGDFTSSKDLESFYRTISEAHRRAHGETYTNHHKAIRAWGWDCRSFRELGVNQGASLACAMRLKIGNVVGVDIDLGPFRPYENLFKEYAEAHAQDFSVLELDSRDPLSAADVDFLHVDSRHTPEHLLSELQVHMPFVRKRALFHDTAQKPRLADVLRDYCRVHPDWRLVEVDTAYPGYTLMARRERPASCSTGPEDEGG